MRRGSDERINIKIKRRKTYSNLLKEYPSMI